MLSATANLQSAQAPTHNISSSATSHDSNTNMFKVLVDAQRPVVKHIPKCCRVQFAHVLSTSINGVLQANDDNRWLLLMLLPYYCLQIPHVRAPNNNRNLTTRIKTALDEFSRFNNAVEVIERLKCLAKPLPGWPRFVSKKNRVYSSIFRVY